MNRESAAVLILMLVGRMQAPRLHRDAWLPAIAAPDREEVASFAIAASAERAQRAVACRRRL